MIFVSATVSVNSSRSGVIRLTTLYEDDVDTSLIRQRRVAVLGFGAQGRAHALNLHDSGVDVVVGLRATSPSRAACAAAGVAVLDIAAAVETSDIVMMLVPDEAQAAVYADAVAPRLRPGAMLAFAHGYNLHYGYIRPRDDLDTVMVAPLAIGDQVRRRFVAGGGVPALLALYHDASGSALAIAAAYGWANGHARAGMIETTIEAETETDLFAEQVVLCGGLTHLITAAYETLTEAGYPDELAYFSCLHEVTLIAEMMQKRGIAGMRESISSTAEFGDYTRGPRVIGADSRAAMQEILAEIRSGQFARELSAEVDAGMPTITRGRKAARRHDIEAVGKRLRALMPWLDDDA